MTRDHILRTAVKRFERVYDDNTRRLITAMITAGRGDDEIGGCVGQADAERDECREEFLRRLEAELDLLDIRQPVTLH